MKRTILRILSMCFVFTTSLQAQNYLIDFLGAGAITTVDSVQVQNLTQGTSLTLNGSDVLHLTNEITGIKTVSIGNKSMRIYPNPVISDCNVEFETGKAGEVRLDLFDIAGRKINSFQNNLSSGLHTLSIGGLGSGVYTLTLTTENGSCSSKIISNSKASGKSTISYVNSETIANTDNSKGNTSVTTNLRSAQTATVDMAYTTGDRILLKGMSGDYSTLISIVPTGSSTQTFNFVAATDCDGNNYTTVTIGTQIWMVENLKTTKYNDCTPIPNVTDNTAWSNLTTGAYCDYDNNTANENKYGHLYNFHAVDSRKLAPTGWHVPSYTEWTTLADYLIANGYNYDGTTSDNKIAKSLCSASMTDWGGWSNPFSGPTPGTPTNGFIKNNSTGFSAIPSGYRNSLGTFLYVDFYTYWWSTTHYDTNNAYIKYIYSQGAYLNGRGNENKLHGLSVRCIKD